MLALSLLVLIMFAVVAAAAAAAAAGFCLAVSFKITDLPGPAAGPLSSSLHADEPLFELSCQA